MADRTVRAIFEARVSGARKGMTDFAKDVAGAGQKVDSLTKDLKTLDAAKVKPSIEVKIDEAKKRLSDLTRELGALKSLEASPEVDLKIADAKKKIADVRGEIKGLNAQRIEVKISTSITETQKRIKEITVELGALRTMEVTPVVTAEIKEAQKKLRDAKSELRELNGAKAEMKVTADTEPAKKEIDKLAGDVGDAGDKGGEEAGTNIVGGILDALRTIPIAGAVVGIGVAVAGGILLGIKQGLQVEAERDLFSAQTGLDEDTSARFGRAAGEAYANAWGESVAANLDTAKFALQAGIIDSDATDTEIENVIAKLQGLSDLFDYDIASSVRGVGNLMKTGLVKDADQAFDFIVAASQKVSSDDLLDTLTEYSNQFATLGIDGQQAFGLIVQGAAAGARDTDKVADTLKEMGIRIREGTKPASDALKLLGLNSKDMVRAFQKGGPDAAAAIGTVFDALRDLEARGGNTQAVIAGLFGGPGEDLGAALYALDIDTAADALGGLDGAAGAADTALTTMSDNASTKMEEAKRNVEVAMDGIKGALAEAFADDIGNAADWVSKNRAPLMQFFLDVISGAFDVSIAFLTFGADAQDAIADVIDGLADLFDSLPGDQSELKSSMNGIADGLRDGAKSIRDDFIPALAEGKAKAEGWAAPEILKARIHDATMEMTGDLAAFVKKVGEKDLPIRINGDTKNAEEVLAALVDNIDGTDGTVLIEGNKVPAEDALAEILRLIQSGAADVQVGADTSPADISVKEAKGRISLAEAAMTVTADLTPAERRLAEFKAKLSKLGIRVSGVTSVGGVHEGGWTGRRAPGLHAGGRVPGMDPGYDNVLWPLNTGGKTLAQPLAGGEFVVNSKDSAFWGPVLEWMNGGGRPGSSSVTNDKSINVESMTVVTPDPRTFPRDIRATPYRAKAKPGR